MNISGKKLHCIDHDETHFLAFHIKAVFTVSLLLSGCATVAKGTNFEVSVKSTPENATVIFIDENKEQKGNSCLTPCKAQLDRQGKYLTTVSKSGYDDYTILIRPRLSADGFIGNVSSAALFGAAGFGVDQATGATNDLYPASLDIILQEKGKTSYRVDENGARIKELFENRVAK